MQEIKDTDILNFSQALVAIKDGFRVARQGWNGKGMFVFLNPGGAHSTVMSRNAHMANHPTDGQNVRIRPHLYMRTAQGDFVPWIASNSDLLVNDWYILK